MNITRQQFTQLQTALLDGYDRNGLRRMVRLGLDMSLDNIAAQGADSDVVFELIEWAERCDKVPALIQAAVEHNDQNAMLQQLQHDAAVWFALGSSMPPADAPRSADLSAAPPAPLSHQTGGDMIVANISGSSGSIAVGKNIQQSTSNTKS